MTNCQCAVHANWRSEPKGAARKIRANGKEEETERRGDQRIVREKTKRNSRRSKTRPCHALATLSAFFIYEIRPSARTRNASLLESLLENETSLVLPFLMNWRNWKISAIVQKNLKIVKEIYREKIFFSFIYPLTSYNTYLQRLKRISLIFVIIRIHCFIYRVDLILFINACKYPLPINNNYDTT